MGHRSPRPQPIHSTQLNGAIDGAADTQAVLVDRRLPGVDMLCNNNETVVHV